MFKLFWQRHIVDTIV